MTIGIVIRLEPISVLLASSFVSAVGLGALYIVQRDISVSLLASVVMGIATAIIIPREKRQSTQ